VVTKISLYDARSSDTVPAHPVSEGCACAPTVVLYYNIVRGGARRRHLSHVTQYAVGVGLKKKGRGGRRRRRVQSNDDNNNNIPSSTPNALAAPHYCSLVVTAVGRPSLVFCVFFPYKNYHFSNNFMAPHGS